MKIEIFTEAGKRFSRQARIEFESLVTLDPQVSRNHLSKHIFDAHYLTMLHHESRLIGTCAIKNNPDYRRDIETRARVRLDETEYFGEVGYLHVLERHRGKGLSEKLMAATLGVAQGKALFATIRSKNVASRRTFEKFGFVSAGASWPSTKVKDDVILYIKQRVAVDCAA